MKNNLRSHGPLTRSVKLELRMCWECRGRFPRRRVKWKLLVSYPGMHHATHMGFFSDIGHAPVVMDAGISKPRWREKRSRRVRNRQFYVSGKRPIELHLDCWESMVTSQMRFSED